MDPNDKSFQLMLQQYAAQLQQQHFAQQQAAAAAAAVAAQQQQASNDKTNLILNALASGVPTLDMPTIVSYLGYGNAVSGTGSSKESNTLNGKWTKLIDVIDEMNRDIRPLYASSRGASDRLRRQIMQARQLVRECLVEADRLQRGSSSSSSSNATTSNSNA